MVKERESSWISGGKDEESEENMDWADEETYFVMVN